MGKSLDFVKERIKNYSDNMNVDDYKNAEEYSFLKALDDYPEVKELVKDNTFIITVDGTDEHGIRGSKKVTFTYNPDAPFEYYTMESCRCDGTLAYMIEMIDRIFRKVATANTYNIDNVPEDYVTNTWNYDVEYMVGNFIINEELGDFGTTEKPWLKSRFTVMLPLICRVVKNK